MTEQQMPKTDSQLGQEMQRGNPAAFSEIVERFLKPVYTVCLRCLRDPADAQDVTQDVFVRLGKGIATYDPSRPLSSWIFRIAYNRCMDYLKKRGRNLEKSVEELDLAAEDVPPVDENSGDSKLLALVWGTLDEISEPNRMLLLFKYRFEMKNGEIADALGINENNLRVRLYRAKLELRAAVRRKMSEEDKQ